MLTCDHYVFNTYLYIVLSILLIILIVLLNDQYGIFTQIINLLFGGNTLQLIISFIILIIVFFVLIYFLHTIDPNEIFISNTIWLVLIIIIAIILIPTIYFGKLTDVVGLASILTIIIVIVTGLLGYYAGDKIITFNWDAYLNFALLALIIVFALGQYFITNVKTMSTFFYIISIVSLIIFVLLLLSNHKKLKENADKCIDGKVVPNYPSESFGLIIKIINVFQDLIVILSNSRH
jgi:hypothetical protein